MRRKPDIKYQNNHKILFNCLKIQLEILKNCAPTLKSGGIMVYSTCTIAKEENQMVVAEFLTAHPEFEKIELDLEMKLQPAIHEQMLVLYPENVYDRRLSLFVQCEKIAKRGGQKDGDSISIRHRQAAQYESRLCKCFTNQAGMYLAILADGMGGHLAGDVASKMAVDGLGCCLVDLNY